MVAKTNYLLHSNCFADRARATIEHAHAPAPLGDGVDDDAVVANAADVTLVVAALVATQIHAADAYASVLRLMTAMPASLLLSLSHAVRLRG